MNFNIYELLAKAHQFAQGLYISHVKDKTNRFTLDDIHTMQSPQILNSEYGPVWVEGMSLGAISAYHDQLRSSLLERGIEIGDFDDGDSDKA